MFELWALIQDEAEAVSGYLKFIQNHIDDPVCTAAIQVIEDIVQDEVDHLNALKKVWNDHAGPDKTKDSVELANTVIRQLRDKRKVDEIREQRMKEEFREEMKERREDTKEAEKLI
jgi:rubrerythrin